MTTVSRSRGDSASAVVAAVLEQVRQAVPEGLECEPTLDDPLDELGLDSLARMVVLNRLEEVFQCVSAKTRCTTWKPAAT